MRNAFVVLVSLYIGLASGFIVPLGVTQKFSDSMTKTNIDNKNITQLEKTEKGFIDELLYENANEKENNLKERSFIFLNQKFKSKLKNQGYGLHVHDWIPRVNEDRAFLISKDSARFEDKPYKFSAENVDNSKRVIMSNYKIKVTDIPAYEPHVSNTQTSKLMNRNYNRPKYEFNENLQDSRTYNQREYLELLKPPLIRPAGDEIKFRNSYNNNNDDLLKSKDDEAYRYEPYTFPEVEISNSQYNQKQSNQFGFLKYPSQKNYGTHNNKSYNNIPKYSDVSVHKPIDNNFDERRLTETNNIGYLQHKVTKENMNHGDCSYRNCITKNNGQEVNNYKNTGTLQKCNCANRLNLISKDQSATIDRSQREKLKDNSQSPLLSPPEGNDYEEMFNEEDDIVNVVNKLSDTLRS